MSENLIHIFVYGTLKPGECNYQRYCARRVVQERLAIAEGKLFNLSLGYPGMTEGICWVSGVVLSFPDPSIFEDLDCLEDYQPHRPPEQNEYQRQEIQTYTPDKHPLEVAWVYRMNPAKIQQYQGVYLPGGNWSSQIQNRRSSKGR
ncbi:AIG2-like family protein [Lyngbya aestuarii BL J]|uniref:AIG2-like family protein n=1 Tax=Lyngbya aestuarii BL J TaxID=1348334 RepID=U7QF39_9CYAN|nr:gamma-glutamylcyclotransferase [Lyngbya aestuarii]ERT06564.1 AIG2-like family protein [Lyngbya aestuarii BL J]